MLIKLMMLFNELRYGNMFVIGIIKFNGECDGNWLILMIVYSIYKYNMCWLRNE